MRKASPEGICNLLAIILNGQNPSADALTECRQRGYLCLERYYSVYRSQRHLCNRIDTIAELRHFYTVIQSYIFLVLLLLSYTMIFLLSFKMHIKKAVQLFKRNDI